MKRSPIGVWFSIALAILVASIWAGSKLGFAFSRYWYSHHQEDRGGLSDADRRSVESELGELEAVQMIRVLNLLNRDGRDQRFREKQVERLEIIKHESQFPVIKSLVDLELGLRYVQVAVLEEQDSRHDLAEQHIQSAQILFRSLGWQDYSEKTLKTVASQRNGMIGYPPVKTQQK